jgi:hypothetical protein
MGVWKIGTVATVPEGWGFNITDERGKPLVAFAYETHGEAAVAARHVEAAVERALGVHPILQE